MSRSRGRYFRRSMLALRRQLARRRRSPSDQHMWNAVRAVLDLAPLYGRRQLYRKAR